MKTITLRPKLLGALLALLLVAGDAVPARAGLWSGACGLRITIQFHAPVRPPLSSPSYDFEAVGAADLDPLTSGVQPCAFTLTGSALGGTSAGGSGLATAWSCAVTVARGSWQQTFDPEGPASFAGSHLLAGSWGAWTLQVQSPSLSVIGAGEFTLQAVDALKTPSCATGSLETVTLVGVLVFQDP